MTHVSTVHIYVLNKEISKSGRFARPAKAARLHRNHLNAETTARADSILKRLSNILISILNAAELMISKHHDALKWNMLNHKDDITHPDCQPVKAEGRVSSH